MAWRLLWLLVGVRGSPLGQHWVRVGCVLLCVLGLPCLLPLLTLCVGGCRPSLASGVVFAGVCVGGYVASGLLGWRANGVSGGRGPWWLLLLRRWLLHGRRGGGLLWGGASAIVAWLAQKLRWRCHFC